MQIFNFHPDTGHFIAAGAADPDPLDEGAWLIPAHATTEAPPSYDEDTQFARWDGQQWFIENVPTPAPPPAPPTVVEIKAAMLPELRRVRDLALNVLDGYQVDALTNGDTAAAQAIRDAKGVCRDLPALDTGAATDAASLKALFVARLAQVVAMAPQAVRPSLTTSLGDYAA